MVKDIEIIAMEFLSEDFSLPLFSKTTVLVTCPHTVSTINPFEEGEPLLK